MNSTVQVFVSGLVLIGVITALVLPGRQTVGVIRQTGDSLISKPLDTAIRG